MAALRGARLWEIPLDGTKVGKPRAHFTDDYGRLRSVIVSHDGKSLLLSSSNTDGRGNPDQDDDKLYRSPDSDMPASPKRIAAWCAGSSSPWSALSGPDRAPG